MVSTMINILYFKFLLIEEDRFYIYLICITSEEIWFSRKIGTSSMKAQASSICWACLANLRASIFPLLPTWR